MSIENLSHDELEQRITEWESEIPHCNPLARDCLRAMIREAYQRLIREGRYPQSFLDQIIAGRDCCFSAELVGSTIADQGKYLTLVKEGTWADTQGELKIAEKALVKLVKSLYDLVDKKVTESHVSRIIQLTR